jgi:hypothetical protein
MPELRTHVAEFSLRNDYALPPWLPANLEADCAKRALQDTVSQILISRKNFVDGAPGNDLESAIIVPLEPGNYTAVVRGAGNTVGTGVVDTFDLDSGSTARLANIATRGFVQPGDKLMIAGFIVQNSTVRVVVRAIGPSLTQFGISNALPDTTVQLRDQNAALVLENDDWKTSQQAELESAGLQQATISRPRLSQISRPVNTPGRCAAKGTRAELA